MSEGPATDRQNEPVIDPTANVLQLVEAAVKRLNDLFDLESTHTKEMAALREAHAVSLASAETARLDAIRAVDNTAVQQAALVAETRATALANTVAASAEAMRSQVAAAAAAAATSLAAALVPIQERLAELTRLQYEQQGQKQQVVEGRAADADLAPIMDALAALTHAEERRQGGKDQVVTSRATGSNVVLWVSLAVGVIGVFFGFVSLAIAITVFLTK